MPSTSALGGVWRFVMHGPDGRDYQNRVTYDEIVPPERLVYHHGGGEDVEPVAVHPDARPSRISATAKPASPGTAVSRSAEERARVIKEYGADKGLAQTMARLAEHVAALASPGATE